MWARYPNFSKITLNQPLIKILCHIDGERGLPVGGIQTNIEVGHIFDDNNSLRDLYNIFMNLKTDYYVPEQELEELLQKQRELVKKQRESQKVVDLLSLGSFYHKWEQQHRIDLRFPIKLSQEAKELIKNKDNEVSIILDEEGFEKKEKEEETINKKRNIFLAYSSHFIYLYI